MSTRIAPPAAVFALRHGAPAGAAPVPAARFARRDGAKRGFARPAGLSPAFAAANGRLTPEICTA